jgi:phosphonate transport system permease protein
MYQHIPWAELLLSMGETGLMALVATGIATVLSIPAGMLASASIMPRYIAQPMRWILSFCRSMPALVWALLFVALYGFGTLTGIIALTVYSVGYLGKLFAESFESIDHRSSQVLADLGASRIEQFFHAVLPSARVLLVANALFILEYNVRSAAILGIVDAGGIGFYLKQYLDLREYQAAVVCVVLIFITVSLVDLLSQRVRGKLSVGRC